MTKYLILHGTAASPKDNWFMWLKGKLIGESNEVWLPQLPDADKPNTKTYNDFLLSNSDFVIDSSTILIGHSSGAVEIMSLIEHLPKDATVKAAVLVSAFKDDLKWNSLIGLFQEPFNFELIKSRCNQFFFIHSDNDPYVPLEQAKYLCNVLEGKLIIMEGQGHFSTEISPDYKQFPELLEIIESVR